MSQSHVTDQTAAEDVVLGDDDVEVTQHLRQLLAIRLRLLLQTQTHSLGNRGAQLKPVKSN